MKIIDLLNKMANGERLPNKIKLDGKIWTCKEDRKYYNQCEIELIDWYGNELQRCLNDYIELIENETIDIDNIEELLKIEEYEVDKTDTVINRNKINELVQAVKQLNKEIKSIKEKI